MIRCKVSFLYYALATQLHKKIQPTLMSLLIILAFLVTKKLTVCICKIRNAREKVAPFIMNSVDPSEQFLWDSITEIEKRQQTSVTIYSANYTFLRSI